MKSWVVLAVAILFAAACSSEGAEPSATESVNATTGNPSTTAESPTETNPSGGLTCWTSPSAGAADGIHLFDDTETWGLVEPLLGMHGHAAAWGDLDGDDMVDLFVGTFADRDADAYQFRGAAGASPDRVLSQVSGGFQFAPIDEMFTRTSGAVFADPDGDGDLDIVVSRNWDDDTPDAPATMILRNDGGSLSPVTIEALPDDFGGRSIGVLDFNADGRPDLFITEDRWSGGRSILLANEGDLIFTDVTAQAGIATDAHGLGVATTDLTNDGHQDILVTGSNRLFVANGDGTFLEAAGVIAPWTFYGEEDDVAGVSVADVNRDGNQDVLVGQHFNSTIEFGEEVPVRLYLNRGPDENGMPVLEDVTEESGLVGLPTKAPHVELNDMDNDGWPDVVTSASAEDGTQPAIFRHLGLEGDVPRFEAPSGLGDPQYWVAGPTTDLDRDGRLDSLMVEWEPSLPTVLFRNDSDSGHWLEVSVSPESGFGIGWRVEVYQAGGIGVPESILGVREITVTQGYSSGVAPIAHFGLGEVDVVDVRLIEPASGTTTDFPGVAADQHIRAPAGCS